MVDVPRVLERASLHEMQTSVSLGKFSIKYIAIYFYSFDV